MDIKGKFAHQPQISYSMLQSNWKPGATAVEEICSMWHYDLLFGPSKSGTPDSVLAPLHVDSPPLDYQGSSSPPLDHVESLFLCTSGDYIDDNIDMPDSIQDSHSPEYVYPLFSPPFSSINPLNPQARIPWESGTCINLEDNGPMVELSVKKAIQSARDTSDSDELDMIISDHHEAQHVDFPHLDMVKQKQLVAAMLRQHVKQYLDKALCEELALCGCVHTIQKDEEGSCNPEDHSLQCKMRMDYAMWVMWMQERAIRNEGLDLVQRLLACAEAVACRDARQAQALLQGVQQLASPYGDSLQRVAFCFMEGLAARLFQHNVAGNTSTLVEYLNFFFSCGSQVTGMSEIQSIYHLHL